MLGSAIVAVNPLPILFTVTGTGSVCTGDPGLAVALLGSTSGVNYQLKNGAANVGTAKAGTGATLTWTNNSTAGTYTVVATNSTTACTATMIGSAVITVNGLPTAFTVSGTGSTAFCPGLTTVNVTLSSSQTGVNYQLKLNGADAGLPIAGTGALLTWSNLAAA